MVFSFALNIGTVYSVLQSYGSELQIVVSLYTKQFCPSFVFNLGVNFLFCG